MSVIERRVSIKSTDMPDICQYDAIMFANQSLVNSGLDRDLASYLKKEFDRKYGPTWHVIAGENFGSYFTHEFRQFIFFEIDDMNVLLWKSA